MSKGKGEVRHRIKNGTVNDSVSSDKVKFRRTRKRDQHTTLNYKLCVSVVIVTILLTFIAVYCGYQYYLFYKINLSRQPINLPSVIVEDALDKLTLWGTYRPQLFFGMKPRVKFPVLGGLMWFTQTGVPQRPDIRYWCQNDRGIKKFNWDIHDWRRIGSQTIVDSHQTLITSFIKNEASWVAKMDINNINSKFSTSVLWYFYLPETTRGYIKPEIVNNKLISLRGSTSNLGDFKVSFDVSHRAAHKKPQFSYLISHVPREDRILQSIENGFRFKEDERLINLVGQMNIPRTLNENIWVFEITGSGNFTVYVTYESAISKGEILSKDNFQSYFSKYSSKFHKKFNNTFHYSGYNSHQIQLAKSALSNVIGGVGYFYGQSQIISSWMPEDEKQPLLYWPASLLTATPSRTMFPRGFLWDEGFHTMLLARWEPSLALDIIGHWLDLMNAEGWIPREQIIGWEARAKVPEEFIVQNSRIGNPPTLMLTLEDIDDMYDSLDETSKKYYKNFLSKAILRLEAWFNWFNTTQIGVGYSNYVWKGRNLDNPRHLNPLTLSSGLDDYPRASHPTSEERHVDLRCWMAVFANVLAKLERRIGRNDAIYQSWATVLYDELLLDENHWDSKRGVYSDWGLHSDAVRLRRHRKQKRHPNGQLYEEEELIRVEDKGIGGRHGDDSTAPHKGPIPHIGYVSFFPLLLRILMPNSTRLATLLDKLGDRRLLWSRYGLRSLSTSSSMYRAKNSEHDPPYWRGAIWINMNFLAVRALNFYSRQAAQAEKSSATRLLKELRTNLVSSILGNFDKTGYLWEQYDDETGLGQRAHPFSGWTALVVLIMEKDNNVAS